MAITVVINTKNSVSTLQQAIQSATCADELIVVDMQSSDGTPELAKQLGAKVFFHKDVGYVEPARQFAIEKVTHEWVLVLDADEEIPPTLIEKLKSLISGEQQCSAVAIPRKNIMFGQWIAHAGWWPDYQIRFFRKGKVRWPEKIHAVPQVTGKTFELEASEDFAIIHHNYNTVSAFIQRMDRYTTVQAENQGRLQKKLSTKECVTSFSDEFMQRAFILGGVHGGALSIALSFLQASSELVSLLKRWEISGEYPKVPNPSIDLTTLDQFRAHMAFWIATTHIERSSGVTKLWWRLRRKLRV